MRFPRRPEILFHAEMYPDGSCLKPRTSTLRKFRRFRHFRYSQQLTIKLSCRIFCSCRHRQLNMVNSDDLRRAGGEVCVCGVSSEKAADVHQFTWNIGKNILDEIAKVFLNSVGDVKWFACRNSENVVIVHAVFDLFEEPDRFGIDDSARWDRETCQ